MNSYTVWVMAEWRPVVGYEGHYEVSSDGEVRSVPRTLVNASGRPHSVRGGVLSPSRRNHHLQVNLWKNNQQRSMTVHLLVLEAFLGPRPPGMWGLHWDDDPENNKLDNLRWAPVYENMADAVRNGKVVWRRPTHCPHGHEYAPENTEWTRRRAKDGTIRETPVCITCRRKRARDRYHAQKNEVGLSGVR